VLLETGENAGPDPESCLGTASSSSLYDAVPGGHELTVDVENIGDRNYRGSAGAPLALYRQSFTANVLTD
jgi:hypothetical protein